MELTHAFLETWVSENIERTPDIERVVTGNELWESFKDSVPSLKPQRDVFLSMMGQVLKTLGFEKVSFYKSRSRKFGYCGLVIKCRVDTVHSTCQIVENVKSWASSKLSPASPTDSVSKEDAWTSFAKFAHLDMTERHRQQFFAIFGNHVAGQGPFKAVSSSRKRKSFVGLRFKESSHRDNELPSTRGKTNEEEVQHVGIKEQTVRADDWMSYGSDMTDGNSSDCLNVGQLDSAASNKHDAVHEHTSNEELGIGSDTETDAISAVPTDKDSVYEDELTANNLDEDTIDNTDQEVIDTNNIDNIDLTSLSSPGFQACDEDVSAQETIFRRHHKKLKYFIPSHLPGKPKSFKSY